MNSYMKLSFFVTFVLFQACINLTEASNCGCRRFNNCYKKMLNDLKKFDEASCVSDASVGTSTVMIFLKALSEYCSRVIQIKNQTLTYEGRQLYEVEIGYPFTNTTEDKRPVIVIDAGQEAGVESVGFALFIIEQLVSCKENMNMIVQTRWIIMPSTNPDGLEYVRYNRNRWRKNMRPLEDGISYGVDISRNFEGNWKYCPTVQNGFASVYPGKAAASENETRFIQEVLNKYEKKMQLYISIRRDGHSIGYPTGFDVQASPKAPLKRIAGLVAKKVNQKAGAVYLFTNQSIYDLNRGPRCGHSVDYVHQKMGVLHSYELRVFMNSENEIMSKFQTLPRGHEATLRNGYFTGIRELYNLVMPANKTKFKVEQVL